MNAQTERDTYNGWTNYATWRVNLELCDDYISSRVDDIAEEIAREYITADELPDIQQWADELEEMVDDVLTNYGEIRDGIALDYARSFVSDVDWRQIAEHATEQVTERLAYDAMEAAAS